MYGAIYWLHKLKDGSCTASNKTLGEIINAKERGVRAGLERLEAAGYIKRVFSDDFNRSNIECLVVFEFKGGGTTVPEGRHENVKGVGTTVPQKNKTIKRKVNNTHTEDGVGGRVVAEIIDLFGAVNPSHRLLFMRNNQRDAVQRLLSQYGEDRLRAMIAYLPKSNADTYAPTITTPLELEGKMGKLVAWAQKQKTRSTSKSKELIA